MRQARCISPASADTVTSLRERPGSRAPPAAAESATTSLTPHSAALPTAATSATSALEPLAATVVPAQTDFVNMSLSTHVLPRSTCRRPPQESDAELPSSTMAGGEPAVEPARSEGLVCVSLTGSPTVLTPSTGAAGGGGGGGSGDWEGGSSPRRADAPVPVDIGTAAAATPATEEGELDAGGAATAEVPARRDTDTSMGSMYGLLNTSGQAGEGEGSTTGGGGRPTLRAGGDTRHTEGPSPVPSLGTHTKDHSVAYKPFGQYPVFGKSHPSPRVLEWLGPPSPSHFSSAAGSGRRGGSVSFTSPSITSKRRRSSHAGLAGEPRETPAGVAPPPTTSTQLPGSPKVAEGGYGFSLPSVLPTAVAVPTLAAPQRPASPVTARTDGGTHGNKPRARPPCGPFCQQHFSHALRLAPNVIGFSDGQAAGDGSPLDLGRQRGTQARNVTNAAGVARPPAVVLLGAPGTHAVLRMASFTSFPATPGRDGHGRRASDSESQPLIALAPPTENPREWGGLPWPPSPRAPDPELASLAVSASTDAVAQAPPSLRPRPSAPHEGGSPLGHSSSAPQWETSGGVRNFTALGGCLCQPHLHGTSPPPWDRERGRRSAANSLSGHHHADAAALSFVVGSSPSASAGVEDGPSPSGHRGWPARRRSRRPHRSGAPALPPWATAASPSRAGAPESADPVRTADGGPASRATSRLTGAQQRRGQGKTGSQPAHDSPRHRLSALLASHCPQGSPSLLELQPRSSLRGFRYSGSCLTSPGSPAERADLPWDGDADALIELLPLSLTMSGDGRFTRPTQQRGAPHGRGTGVGAGRQVGMSWSATPASQVSRGVPRTAIKVYHGLDATLVSVSAADSWGVEDGPSRAPPAPREDSREIPPGAAGCVGADRDGAAESGAAAGLDHSRFCGPERAPSPSPADGTNGSDVMGEAEAQERLTRYHTARARRNAVDEEPFLVMASASGATEAALTDPAGSGSHEASPASSHPSPDVAAWGAASPHAGAHPPLFLAMFNRAGDPMVSCSVRSGGAGDEAAGSASDAYPTSISGRPAGDGTETVAGTALLSRTGTAHAPAGHDASPTPRPSAEGGEARTPHPAAAAADDSQQLHSGQR